MDVTSGNNDKQYYTTVGRMQWGERVQLILPDGSSLTLEANKEQGVVYLLGVTTLGARLPVVEVMGDTDSLPEASIHPVTGELVNKHQRASAFRVVFGGSTPVR